MWGCTYCRWQKYIKYPQPPFCAVPAQHAPSSIPCSVLCVPCAAVKGPHILLPEGELVRHSLLEGGHPCVDFNLSLICSTCTLCQCAPPKMALRTLASSLSWIGLANLAILPTLTTAQEWQLHLVNDPSGQARCLDGSSPGYYIRKGSGSGLNVWVVHLQGGSWPHDLKFCRSISAV